jgi:hypothetical protein
MKFYIYIKHNFRYHNYIFLLIYGKRYKKYLNQKIWEKNFFFQKVLTNVIFNFLALNFIFIL